MSRWARRVRAAVGMGLIWGFAWSAVGAFLARVVGVDTDLPLPLLFAPLGFITGVIFSVVLVAIEGRRGFLRTSVSRFAGWGALSGALLTGIIVAGAALRGDAILGELLTFGPPLTIAGALCAAGSVAIAKRAERRELVGHGGLSADRELPEREKR